MHINEKWRWQWLESIENIYASNISTTYENIVVVYISVYTYIGMCVLDVTRLI